MKCTVGCTFYQTHAAVGVTKSGGGVEVGIADEYTTGPVAPRPLDP